MEKHVEELRSAIRLVQGSLTPALRQKITCIITIDTHGRDVIQRLLSERASSVDCFQWQSQLKYFWDAEKVNEEPAWLGLGGLSSTALRSRPDRKADALEATAACPPDEPVPRHLRRKKLSSGSQTRRSLMAMSTWAMGLVSW